MRRQNNYKGATAEGSRRRPGSRWRKKYPAAEKLSGGGKFIRRQNNYPAAGVGGPKIRKKISLCRKLSHSAENTLFHILIHCETIPYTYP